jgi:hypothetical protein
VKVSSKVTINTAKIRTLAKAQIIALEQTAEVLHTQVIQDQVIPFGDTGELQGNTFVDTKDKSKGKVSLVSPSVYSRRLYYHPEYNFRKHENPNAKGKWYQDYVDGGKKAEFCKNTYKKIYKRVSGV